MILKRIVIKKIFCFVLLSIYLFHNVSPISASFLDTNYLNNSSEKNSQNINLKRDYWKYIRKQKEKKDFHKKDLPEVKIQTKEQERVEEQFEDEGISFILPYESKLNISGRKQIGMSYGVIQYADSDEEGKNSYGINEGFDMQQELQVRIKGKVGRKISVDVDYDDTVENKRDISVVYRGFKKGDIIDDKGTIAEKDDFVEEVAFGDINLSLPSTEFSGYNKNLFGLRLKAKHKNLDMIGIFSRTKGLSETKNFDGNSTFEKKDLRDIDYIKRKYYNLYFSDTQKNNDFPLKKRICRNIY